MSKNLSSSDMGKLSAIARRKKFGILNWSEHMKKVRNGKAIKVKPILVKNIDQQAFVGSNGKKVDK